MKIILAKNLGFCYGVKRATEVALKEASLDEGLETFGPLIHNSEFLKLLQTKGIGIADVVDNIQGKKIVIRAHGVPKEIEDKIMNKNIKIIDATCPFVKKVQNLAQKFYKDGYNVLILGDKNHPEVIGIQSYAPNSFVIKDLTDIPRNLKKDKIIFISQTTQDLRKFREIAQTLRKKFKRVVIINTICDTTDKRQKSAKILAKKVDLMIIIGDKNSSNTIRLKEICEIITRTQHIEKRSDLNKEWFKNIKSVGITAGASTPDFLIKDVLKTIKRIDNI
jgi:4-hydroxy-3-methylbut-2-enyl diphosphate reductase